MKRLFAFLAIAGLAALPLYGGEVVISINESNTFQSIEGFGASLTDSSAWLLTNSLTGTQRTNLFKQLFSPTNGIGLNILRQPMGASDFRLANYTYDDMPSGGTDYGLTNFSIAHDQAYIIPLLKQALNVNTNMKFMGTPWSAPAWMKDSGDLYYGRLKTNCYATYAKYFLKYVQSYGSNGLPLFAVSLQNEPLYEPNKYPGMRMDATNQMQFAVLVGQEFASNGISTKILAYDHNWDRFDYPMAVLSNAAANAYISGSAFHAYAGDVSAQSIVHNAFTNKDIYFTENTAGDWGGTFGDVLIWDTSTLIIGGMRNWSKTVIKWNLALDQNGGPKISGGCTGCRGLVTINTSTHAITTNADYYSLGHASKFVKPGARRIESSELPADGPYSVAFVNPDSSLAVIAVNSALAAKNYTLRWQGQSISVPLPSRSVVTFTWPNVAGATADVWMTTGDQTKLLQKQQPAVFRPTTINWKGRTWNVRDTEGTPGNNYWSADCVRVDTNDWLRLQVKTNSTAWYNGQVESADTPSFGTYRWHTVGRPDLLSSNVVGNLSMFANVTHELNIQFARAYDDEPTNLTYIVQPYYAEGHRSASAETLTNTFTTHEFSWNPRTVAYRSWYGHSAQPTNAGAILETWTYEGTDVPGYTNQRAVMNLWQYNGSPPSSSQEMVLADFTYVCSTGTIVRDDFEDGSLGGWWSTFGSGPIGESGGCLSLTPTNGTSMGCLGTNTVSPAKNGLSYIFAANLSTISVATARSAGGPDVWGCQAIVAGSNSVLDPYAVSNAVILRSGYDASANQITLELLTKQNAPGSWGTWRFVGTIENASGFFNGGEGLEVRFTLIYSNYVVAAYYQGSPVSLTTVSGTNDAPHNLSATNFAGSRYVIGAANNDDGRGTVFWEDAHARVAAELPSTAPDPNGDNGESTLVQLGDGNTASTWKNPVGTKYNKLRSQVLYRASQIGMQGLITQIQVKVVSAPDIALSDFAIRMQHTALNDLSSSFINSGWKTNYRANTTIPRSFSGWYEFNLASNFYYNGTNNLLVDFIVNNPTRDDYPPSASTYTPGSGIQGNYGGNNSGDPFIWTSTSGFKYRYTGANYCDIRLAISNDQPVIIGENLSFDDGPRGYLTNVPGWQVEGSVMSGYIKGSPVYHGPNSLKLWKDGGSGDQKVYQFFNAQHTNLYNLGGYILSESTEPFKGSNAHGALLLQWYGASGLIQTDSSGWFTETNMHNVWTFYSVSAIPPLNTTSGRIVCALFSSDDQSGSLYFDRLSVTVEESPPPTVAHAYFVRDEFNDTERSNIWTESWGGGPDAFLTESNFCFWVKPGSNMHQSTGYTTPVDRSNTNYWFVFSASLATISLNTVKSGNDVIALLGVCSAADNPWWVTSSISLYGYYDRDADQFWWQFLTKSNAPAANGPERFSCTMTNVSKYLNGSNRIRISLALDASRYEIQFNDASGYPVPYTLNNGSPRGDHNTGRRLNSGYWFIGAQADVTNRGWVSWDRTDVRTTLAPTCAVAFAAQTSTDGSGIVSMNTLVCDRNGDLCRLRIQASTNGGAEWFNPWGSAVDSTVGAEIAPTQTLLQVVSICTTNPVYGLTVTNIVSFSWDTRSTCNGTSLSGMTLSNVLLRATADDGDVSCQTPAVEPFLVDNQAPSAGSASVIVETGAVYTLNLDLYATWSGFLDDGAGISGYYYNLADNGGTTSGTWTVETNALVPVAAPDAVNTVFVWSRDEYGNLSTAVSNSILALNPAGDYDGDDLENSQEAVFGANLFVADTDGDTIRDGWEATYGMSPTNNSDAATDTDGDGYNNLAEYYCDTHPSNIESRLIFEAFTGVDPLVCWNSSTARVYTLYYSDLPDTGWQPLDGSTNISGTGGTMTFTGSVETTTYRLYKLGVRFP